ncbi:oxygen-independent coproporphyrinogen III oxidase [Leptolyngbya sp. PCC 6406]|uniref:oxygen-independent coproporphyrinogen III oxidase n=1 Tax=Leptolyngbya sp. PCC 6406 TaxID=1173264 RepID=UPI0002AC09B5|nr:oxygen-independent coproporphyrinogen III oxidase [Leptolyngbya sp. PCC 6406]
MSTFTDFGGKTTAIAAFPTPFPDLGPAQQTHGQPDFQFDADWFHPDLLQKYDRPIPRYTSYPPATELKAEFDPQGFEQAIAQGNHHQRPLSLYVHVPFCDRPCYFCGCNVIITQQRDRATRPYLKALERHIEVMAQGVDRQRPVTQLHWGGGTPNYLDLGEMEQLWTMLSRRFSFAPGAECSIEVNPRLVTREMILHLRQLGFNRISFGIQDFDPRVQAAVNRVQPEAMLFQAMDWIREAGFDSVNVDLIYGLPYQTPATFQRTIEKTLHLDPNRIAVFNFAYVPWMKPIQRRINADALPSPAAKLEMFHTTIDQLQQGGYRFIGMDHFAKPTDELAIAQSQGKLHRNFQGYTTQGDAELLGFGVTAISMFQDVYTQNAKGLQAFYRAVDQGVMPLERGVRLSQDDQIRRTLIQELMCHFYLSKAKIARCYGLDFDAYFARELRDLWPLQGDGLLQVSPTEITVTPIGRLLIRNIAAVFDPYLRHRQQGQFSQSL